MKKGTLLSVFNISIFGDYLKSFYFDFWPHLVHFGLFWPNICYHVNFDFGQFLAFISTQLLVQLSPLYFEPFLVHFGNFS